jgi:hypothetical protein
LAAIGPLVAALHLVHLVPAADALADPAIYTGIGLLITSIVTAVTSILWLRRSSQLQQATEELRLTEEQKALVLDGSSEIIFQLDTQGRWQFLNPAWEAISGHPIPLSLGRPIFDFLLPADRQRCQTEFSDAMKRREGCKQEVRLLTTSGRLRCLEVHARPLRDHDGQLIGIAGTMMDITERREAEERFRHTFEQAAVGIAHVDPDGTVIRANQRLCDILDLPAAALKERSIFSLVHGDEDTPLPAHYRRLMQGDEPSASLEIRLQRHDGSAAWVNLTSSRVSDVNGRAEYFIDVIEDISARHRDQEALRQSEARALSALRQLSFHLEHIPLGCIITDGSGRISYWNPAAAAIFGWTAEEARHRLLVELLAPPAFRSFVEDAWLRLLDGEGTRQAVLEGRHRDGRPLTCEWHGTTLPGGSDGETGTLCMVNDISERTRFEHSLNVVTRGVAATIGTPFFISLAQHLCDALETEIALVAELLPDQPGTVRTIGFSVDGTQQDPTAFELAGTPAEPLERRSLQIVEQGVRSLLPPGHCLALLGAESYAGITLFNDIDVPIGLLVVMGRHPMSRRQITETLLQIFASRAAVELERRRSETALRLSEERFAEIFNQDEDALALIEQHPFRILAVNPAAQRLFGADLKELTGWHPFRFLGKRTFVEMAQRIREGAGAGSIFMERARHRRADGTVLTLSVRLQLLQLGGDTIVFCNIRDITEKTRLEDEVRVTQARLIHTNKMSSLGLLVSSITHEINNPNNYISVNAQTLADVWHDAAPLLEEQRQLHGDFSLAGIPAGEMIPLTERLIGGIGEGSRRISAIVGSMREYAKTDSGYLREGFSLNRLVDNALAILWHLVKKRTDNLQLQLAPDLPLLQGNPQQIEQVIINLVVNALQALPDKGRGITITTAPLPDGQGISLTVRDEGTGMERQVLERIAEPFFTTKGDRGGTGLGLYISSSILKEHNGSIVYESAPGKGTTATVILPVPRGQKKGVPAIMPAPLDDPETEPLPQRARQ